MQNIYDEFEKRFTSSWFSSDWSEVNAPKVEEKPVRKDLAMLEAELEEINKKIENITQKQLILANLAKFYNET